MPFILTPFQAPFDAYFDWTTTQGAFVDAAAQVCQQYATFTRDGILTQVGGAVLGAMRQVWAGEVTTLGSARYRYVKNDGLSPHEPLQNAWLRIMGYGDLEGQNPVIMLDSVLHDDVSAMQRLAGLHDPSVLKTMTASEVMYRNLDILRQVGIGDGKIKELMSDILKFMGANGL